MNNTVLFITAFKDINRGSWAIFTRSIQDYLSWFKNLTQTPIKLICYCDEDIKQHIVKECEFTDVYPYDAEETFFKYIDKEKSIMESEYFKHLIAHRCKPEVNRPGYNIVNHNKFVFVQRAKNMFPNYSHYSWIDFGYIREKTSIPQTLDFRTLDDIKVIYSAFWEPNPDHIRAPVVQCQYPDDVIQGSMFIVPKNKVDWLLEEYTKMVMYYFENNLVDDDQALIMQLYKQHHTEFTLIIRENWFELLNYYASTNSIENITPIHK